ncbi:MAG: hypothetical protein GQ530_07495 [Desulfuromonadales bacterium]|nr:hypothetical protein [Desulfuromonadales bacterium]
MRPVGNSAFQPSSPVRAILVQSLCFVTILILTASPLYAIEQDQLNSVHNSILALDSARKTALLELEEISSSSREVADYKDFIIYLNTRIVSYCIELSELGGTAALEGLPCPADPMMAGTGEPTVSSGEAVFYTTGSGAATGPGTGRSGPGASQTQAEKTAALDGDFLVALGEFDEMLLKEEEKVAARVPSQRESGSSGQAGTGGSAGASGETGKDGSGEAGEQGEGTEGDAVAAGSPDGQTDRSGTAPGTQSSDRGAQSSGGGRGGTGDAVTDHSRYGAPGGKLPPPEDDDIVARQLREAAEKEPDPELKQKLWEEYWKYKGVSK